MSEYHIGPVLRHIPSLFQVCQVTTVLIKTMQVLPSRCENFYYDGHFGIE